MEESLTDKQRKFVELYTRGKMDKVHAARAAGYQGSGANKAGSRLLKNPIVRRAIESIQAEGRTMAVYGLAEAMKEADEVCAFAKLHKNAMAYMKATELRAKLSGLLIDRVEVVEVDLTGALARAEARVLNGIQGPGSHGPISWVPRIAGSPAVDQEAGPADGESDPHLTNASEEP
jgi:phage terminase small subunit